METYPNDVRIVVKNNALPFHKRAMPAAKAFLAAHKQGKGWEYHDKLFANMKALEDADLTRYAEEIGLDAAKFAADMADPATQALVQADMDLAAKVNARGTPNFFVNGRNLRGAVPFENFDDLIKEELAKAKKVVEGGVPAGEYYNKIMEKAKTFEPLEEKVNEFTHVGRPFKGNPDGDIIIYEYSDFQ